VIVYGRNPVREAIAAARRPVHRIWATKAASKEFPGAAVAGGEEIEQLAGTSSHQGVCAEVGDYPYVEPPSLLAHPDELLVVLDEVQDPQNLGAIARSAECAGAAGLVIGERRSAEVTPAVCKASAGAVEHLAIARARNTADFLQQAKDAGFWIYGAAAGGAPYTSVDYSGGRILVLGAEGRGLRPRVAGACDLLIGLPLRGRVESLNVSAAAAVLLYGMSPPDATFPANA
jgi:23S rRNA (guanosine2251-2'-O)-methyltransferase